MTKGISPGIAATEELIANLSHPEFAERRDLIGVEKEGKVQLLYPLRGGFLGLIVYGENQYPLANQYVLAAKTVKEKLIPIAEQLKTREGQVLSGRRISVYTMRKNLERFSNLMNKIDGRPEIQVDMNAAIDALKQEHPEDDCLNKKDSQPVPYRDRYDALFQALEEKTFLESNKIGEDLDLKKKNDQVDTVAMAKTLYCVLRDHSGLVAYCFNCKEIRETLEVLRRKITRADAPENTEINAYFEAIDEVLEPNNLKRAKEECMKKLAQIGLDALCEIFQKPYVTVEELASNLKEIEELQAEFKALQENSKDKPLEIVEEILKPENLAAEIERMTEELATRKLIKFLECPPNTLEQFIAELKGHLYLNSSTTIEKLIDALSVIFEEGIEIVGEFKLISGSGVICVRKNDLRSIELTIRKYFGNFSKLEQALEKATIRQLANSSIAWEEPIIEEAPFEGYQ